MSRAVKVPEALYSELCAEADRGGVSVMEALQRRLRSGAEELGTLRTAREVLEKQLREAQATLNQVAASQQTGKAETASLRAVAARLREAVIAKAEQINALEDVVATQREDASAVRRDRAAALHKAEEQRRMLQAVAVAAGVALVGWLAWRWWRERRALPAAVAQRQQPVQEGPQEAALSRWQ
jgi:chromosome segregation ATPase